MGDRKPKGAMNVERRTWDKDYYEKLAKERAEQGDVPVKKVGIINSNKEEFKPAMKGAAGPSGSQRAYLKARQNELGLADGVGKVKMVTTAAAPQSQGGWWCAVCQCNLKDSLNYLDHINGKKHNRNLNFSMRVERVGVDKVRDRLSILKRKQDEAETPKVPAIKEYEAKMEKQREEEEALKRQRKEAKDSKKRGREEEEEEEEDDGIDPEMKAMLGFGGFGSSRK